MLHPSSRLCLETAFFALAVAVATLILACGNGDADQSERAWTGEPEGKLVFVSFRDGNQEIYIMNADGSAERNLTNHESDDFDPDISRDGSRIAFVSKRSGTTTIYAMNSDGSAVEEVPQTAGALSPRWSRDGSSIAFSSGGSIYVTDLEGGDPRLLMQAEDETTAAPCRAGSFPGGWSPDDQRIAYYAASVSRAIGQICTVSADDGRVEVLAEAPDAYLIEPAYSPDGRQVVYRAIIDGQYDIWVVDVKSGERTNITAGPERDIEPSWSPSGSWIAFGAHRRGTPNFDIFIMRPDGSDVRRLTEDPAKEANPVWGP